MFNVKKTLFLFLLPAFAAACIPAPGLVMELEGEYDVNLSAVPEMGVPFAAYHDRAVFYALYDPRVFVELSSERLVLEPATRDYAEALELNEEIGWNYILHDQLVGLANAGALHVPDYDNASLCAGPSLIIGKNPPADHLVTKECGNWKQYPEYAKGGETFGCDETLIEDPFPSPAPSPTPEIVIPYDKYEDKARQQPFYWLGEVWRSIFS